MKHNFVEAQYEQLAREQFCKIINNIPFVSDIEIMPIDIYQGLNGFCAVVHFVAQESSMNFQIEVKSNGERRFVNQFIEMAIGQNKDNCCVFMAPYISEESAKAIKGSGCSYMDLSENCYILTRRIFLHVSVQPNKFIVKREKKNYPSKFSGAASVLMRTMLNEPERQLQIWNRKLRNGVCLMIMVRC